jgi:hypothetical protein
VSEKEVVLVQLGAGRPVLAMMEDVGRLRPLIDDKGVKCPFLWAKLP